MSRREDRCLGDGGGASSRGERRAAAVDRADDEGNADGGPAAAGPVPLFVRTGAGQTRTVHIELRASVAELEAAVQRKAPGTEEMWLCAVGGGPLLQRQTTLVECGIRAGSSLQLLGRLRGGGELVLRGRAHTIGDDGRLDLAGQGLGVAEVAEVARWLATCAAAVLNSLTIDSTGVPKLEYDFVDGYAESGPRTYTLALGEETIDLSSKNLGAADVNLVAAWMKRPEVSAGVTKLVLSECPLTGGSRRTDVDKDLTGVTTLFDALKTSSVTDLDLRGCRLGRDSMAKLAEYLREATAALTKVDVRGNKGLDKAAVDALRAAAPETCEILADY